MYNVYYLFLIGWNKFKTRNKSRSIRSFCWFSGYCTDYDCRTWIWSYIYLSYAISANHHKSCKGGHLELKMMSFIKDHPTYTIHKQFGFKHICSINIKSFIHFQIKSYLNHVLWRQQSSISNYHKNHTFCKDA
jgi:hypothetical protein